MLTHNDINTLFLQYKDIKDIEIIVTIIALFADGYSYNMDAVNHVVFDIMDGNPYEYISDYSTSKAYSLYESHKYEFVGGFISTFNLHNLFSNLCSMYQRYDSLCDAFHKNILKKRVKYGHEVLINLFGNDAGFQSKKGNGTFYRLNYLLSILCKNYILELTYEESSKCLLPCDDDVLMYAKMNRIISNQDAILTNVVQVTKKSKEIFKDNPMDFYIMYDVCKKNNS